MPAADVVTYGLPAGDWWSGVVEVPLTACVLNFVFSDKERKAWDNNKNTDFHSTVLGGSSFSKLPELLAGEDPPNRLNYFPTTSQSVPLPMSAVQFCLCTQLTQSLILSFADGFGSEKLLEVLYTSIRKEAESEDRQAEERAAKGARKKVMAKGEALERRRAAMHEVLYTVPATPEAGRPVDIYYNPELTPLRGRPDIFVRGSWNRYQKQESAYCIQVRIGLNPKP